MVKRREDFTREQFKKYWLEQHSKLEKVAVQTGPISRIVASFSTGESFIYDEAAGRRVLSEKEPPWDGMVELYFNSVDELKARIQSTFSGEMREDEKNFIDLSEDQVYVITEEYVQNVQSDLLIQRPMIKGVRIVKRRKDFTLEQYKKYSREQHIKLEKAVASTGPLKKQLASIATGDTFIQSAATGHIVPSGKEPPWDAVGQLYFNSVDELRARFQSAFPARMREDEKNFIDLSQDQPRVTAEEYAIA